NPTCAKPPPPGYFATGDFHHQRAMQPRLVRYPALGHQRSRHTGLRFSRKAATPSAASALWPISAASLASSVRASRWSRAAPSLTARRILATATLLWRENLPR